MTIVALTASWLTTIGIPVQTPPVVVAPMPHESWVAYTKEGVIHSPIGPNEWRRGNDADTLLHEMSHAASYQAGHRPVTPEDAAADEGAAEAVADDLWGPWMHRFAPRVPGIRIVAYYEQMQWFRGLSAMGCRCDPDSRDARRWRWRYVTGDRDAMTAEALRVPLVEP